jgi:hypothetical protein
LIYSFPATLYHLQLRYSLTALDNRYNQAVEGTAKLVTGDRVGEDDKTFSTLPDSIKI